MGYRTQDLIFTLYGDYLGLRGGETWVGHIIELMSNVKTSAQAVRSTLSRMTRKSWLRSRRDGRHSFYATTAKTDALLTEGRRRIYHPRQDSWDGHWFILTYSVPEIQRRRRDRFRQRLTWLGFGRLGPATWISPRDLQTEVRQVTTELGISDKVDFFRAEHLGASKAAILIDRCWDLPQLNRTYRDFIARYELAWATLSDQNGGAAATPRRAFVHRFVMVHDYRSFPYVDPNLPPELLPAGWLGDEAIHLFQNYATELAAPANEYVSAVLATEPGG
jgi:phenylacetic acid degradation operon negative regulatory protein